MVVVKYSVNDVVISSVKFLSPFVKSQESFRIFIKMKIVLSRSCDAKFLSPKNADLLKKDVLDNIILNSVWAISGIKDYKEFVANKDKKKSGVIAVKTQKKGSKNVVEIVDDGCGIGEKDLNNVFIKGFSRRASKGFGLYLAKKTVEKLGGEISLKSEIGKFTKVKVII